VEKRALMVAGVIFLAVGVLHILRLLFKVQVTLNQVDVPLNSSAVAAVVCLALAVWMFKATRK